MKFGHIYSLLLIQSIGAVSTANKVSPTGFNLARNPTLNKGLSFSHEDRAKLQLRGLYPAGTPIDLDLKVELSMKQLRGKSSPLEKYIYLHTIQDSEETLFYAILTRYTSETMPYVYTPTVGEACLQWSNIYRHTPSGLYLSINDKGSIKSVLNNYPKKDIKVIVVTDGERILGLGDLGVNGMGIPIGKLALYTACAGIHPSQCLPVHIDVGTENEVFLKDPYYMGLRQRRVRGTPYDDLLSEFFEASQEMYGRNVLIQFEDFGNANAFKLLSTYQNHATCFNDDIQGTASVVLAGVLATLKLTKKKKLSDHTFLFYGAGEAGVGIANLIATSIQYETGSTLEEARKHIWLYDSKGLIHSGRNDITQHHKLIFAHDLSTIRTNNQINQETTTGSINVATTNGVSNDHTTNLLESIQLIQPTALIGVSAQGGAFTQEICKQMATISEHPLILALSNPTSKAECTAEQAYTWTDGKCVFFSGSPFDPVILPNGRKIVPGQGNNAYIFPGVGLGAVASGALTITDEDFTIAASTLASLVTDTQLSMGCAYPPLENIRAVSLKIAAAVAKNVVKEGRGNPMYIDYTDDQFEKLCASIMYEPKYD